MARPSKARRVCRLPRYRSFAPAEGSTQQQVQLSVEEYEALRLIDYLGLTQQEAAAQMQVSRSALQSTYAEARKKLAMFLVEGRQLQIQGGEYTLCPFRSGGTPVQSKCSLRGGCKGVQSMKVAICYENGLVFQHFGHTQQFKVYDIADGKISHSEVVDTNGQGHGALADVLKDLGVDALICGGIGPGARNALSQAGIALYPGASGLADANAAAFAQGSLAYDPEAQCADHDHGHGEHHCGGHGEHHCGEHSCH